LEVNGKSGKVRVRLEVMATIIKAKNPNKPWTVRYFFEVGSGTPGSASA
jgi:hypothetical protein